MKTILAILVLSYFSISNAQSSYWQQSVNYTINAEIKDKINRVDGKESIVYQNNSPDTLHEIYLHLYWNSFKKDSHAFEDNKIGNPSGESFGEINIDSVTVDNIAYQINVYESIGQIKLRRKIAPGASCIVKLNFNSIIPSCINRSGKENYEGIDFTFTQWYPKICRYDQMGWHTDPYFGREFAGTFGKYQVQITCDKSFVVAGTGQLIGKKYTKNAWVETGNDKPIKNQVTWKFFGENIHDFAFALNKDWLHKELQIDGITFHFFYLQEGEKNWGNIIKNWPTAYQICKKEFGAYPYPQFSFIQAGEGYMEYPMCTMLESSFTSFHTACHEFMHNFFYGMYGTDENLYHWMDEGITCYATERISNVLAKVNNPTTDAKNSYLYAAAENNEEPISTAANHFKNDYAYYNAAYFKGQLFPEIIRYIVGDSIMKNGFAQYYSKWNFKHPDPNDFVKCFENASNMELTWFQNYWLNTTQKIDFSIDSVYQNNELHIKLFKHGIPMPVEFEIKLKNGETLFYYIPLDITNNKKIDFNRTTKTLSTWSSGSKSYEAVINGINLNAIESIQLNPDQILPDIDESNNFYTKTE